MALQDGYHSNPCARPMIAERAECGDFCARDVFDGYGRTKKEQTPCRCQKDMYGTPPSLGSAANPSEPPVSKLPSVFGSHRDPNT